MERRDVLKAGAAAFAAPLLAQTKTKMTTSVMLWTLKGSFEEKLEAAARAGLQSVELVGEYVDWTDTDCDRVKKLVRSLNLGMDTIGSNPSWSRTPTTLVDPAHRESLLASVRKALVAAQKLEIPLALLMAGNTIPGRTHAEQWASMVEGAKQAGDLAAKANVILIVEPLNSLVNHKGYFLPTCVEGLKLIKEVDNPHVKLLFDIYHEQVQIGNVIRTITAAAPYTSVFHVADNPGRREPGTGEMNYVNIYKAIQKAGYTGYVTMEYLPTSDQVASLTQAVKEFHASIA